MRPKPAQTCSARNSICRMTRIKRIAKRILPEWLFTRCVKVRRDHFGGRRQISYAESGEDLLLSSLLGEDKRDGFYVDVGAHHPKRISNTCYFYRRGWRGINIDPLPGMKRLFDLYRPRDVNLECAIALDSGMITYYMFDDSPLNGCSAELSAHRANVQGYLQTGHQQVPTVPLRQALDEHLPPGTEIDFLTVDVEGMDLDVLLSNDWARYRPRFVLVEIKGGLTDIQSNPIYAMLIEQGYHLQGKTLKTALFKDVRNRAMPSL